MIFSQFMQLLTAIFEGLLGIPFFGDLFIFGSGLTVLFVMLVLHIITLYAASRDRRWIAGSILGIIASIIGIVPIIGIFLHWVTFLVLIISVFQPENIEF
ncbi:hypothetical protein [Mammaliicoccus sp. I-M36]|uniref:hypothetical protein n=1 Tax=Mammaliicoccus sp. I-M36 TaxID=2898695 RepID=UPI001EFA506A|nr:hypothetical protein [Mammaliicoccus sp. I-M36]